MANLIGEIAPLSKIGFHRSVPALAESRITPGTRFRPNNHKKIVNLRAYIVIHPLYLILPLFQSRYLVGKIINLNNGNGLLPCVCIHICNDDALKQTTPLFNLVRKQRHPHIYETCIEYMFFWAMSTVFNGRSALLCARRLGKKKASVNLFIYNTILYI